MLMGIPDGHVTHPARTATCRSNAKQYTVRINILTCVFAGGIFGNGRGLMYVYSTLSRRTRPFRGSLQEDEKIHILSYINKSGMTNPNNFPVIII